MHLVPRRLKKRGNRPGKTTPELGRVHNVSAQDDISTKWAATDMDSMSEEVKRLLLSKVIKVAVLTVFRHHQYQFTGNTYKQSGGAAIGLRLTSIVAMIVMDEWAAKFITILDKAKVQIHMIAKYVDDINLVLGMLQAGSRWTNGQVTSCEEWAEEDRQAGRSLEVVTIEVVRAAADSITSWLDFTADIPEYHTSGMAPILDLQMWVQHPGEEEMDSGLGADLLCWTFYRKPISSSKIMRATTAYPWRSKLVMLAMELFRRMRNTTRQLTAQSRANICNRFTVMMYGSGYVRSTIRGVIKSGLSHYYRKLLVDLQGGPRLNDRCEDVDMSKRRAKLWSRELWFKRRRGGDSGTHSKEQGWRRNVDPGARARARGWVHGENQPWTLHSPLNARRRQ